MDQLKIQDSDAFNELLEKLKAKWRETGIKRECDAQNHVGDKEFMILPNTTKYCSMEATDELLKQYPNTENTTTIDICDKCLATKGMAATNVDMGKNLIEHMIKAELEDENSVVYKVVYMMFATEEMMRRLPSSNEEDIVERVFGELDCMY